MEKKNRERETVRERVRSLGGRGLGGQRKETVCIEKIVRIALSLLEPKLFNILFFGLYTTSEATRFRGGLV